VPTRMYTLLETSVGLEDPDLSVQPWKVPMSRICHIPSHWLIGARAFYIWYLRVDPKLDFMYTVGELSTVLAIQRFATIQNSILWLVSRSSGASSGGQWGARRQFFLGKSRQVGWHLEVLIFRANYYRTSKNPFIAEAIVWGIEMM